MTKAMTMIDRSVSFIGEYSAAASGADHMVSDAAQVECGHGSCIHRYFANFWSWQRPVAGSMAACEGRQH